MPSRKLNYPDNNQSARKPQTEDQQVFRDVFEDPPSTEIGNDVLAKITNGHAAGNDCVGRNGSILFQKTKFPAISGRTGYSAHKDGYYIISDSGDIFTEDDVSNLFGWDGGNYDEMTGYVSPTKMKCRDNDPQVGISCFIQGKPNLLKWHKSLEKWIIQLGEELYISDRYFTTYTKILIVSRETPFNGISGYTEFGDDVITQNSNGMFKSMVSKNPLLSYKMNTPVPTVRIEDTGEGDKDHKYQFIYAVSRLSEGKNFRNRETEDILIETESGTNKIDENRRDWAVIDTEKPIASPTETYQELVCGATVNTNPVGGPWNVDDSTFGLTMNGIDINVAVNYTDADTMFEVAELTQAGLRDWIPEATCEWDAENTRFKFTAGKITGSTISFLRAGITGTDVHGAFEGTAAEGGAINDVGIGAPHVIRTLYIPVDAITGAVEWHWTHFSIYRSADIGPSGYKLSTAGNRIVNSPDMYIWDKDLRVAASFFARRIDGVIELRFGEFEIGDVGSVIEFDDGTRIELETYIDSKHMGYSDAYYYKDSSDWQAACIGNGRVMRFTQSGNIITRTHGHTFSASDVRKPIWYHNGYQTYITEYIDENQVKVEDDTDRVVSGITIEPTYRNFNDALSDEKLLPRASGWTCKNRFFREFKPGNIVIQQPGYLFTGARGQKEWRYCQLESGYKQFAGYHYREFQKMDVEDKIINAAEFPNRYSILCMASTFTGAANNAQEFTIPETLQTIFVVSGLNKVANIGLAHEGAIVSIDDDYVRIVTNNGEIRDFNGWEFGADLTVDGTSQMGRMKSAIEDAWPEFNTMFSRLNGFIAWWKIK